MEQYLLRRKRNGQFSDKGRVVKLPKNWGKMKVEGSNGSVSYVNLEDWPTESYSATTTRVKGDSLYEAEEIKDLYQKHLAIRNWIIVILTIIICVLLWR